MINLEFSNRLNAELNSRGILCVPLQSVNLDIVTFKEIEKYISYPRPRLSTLPRTIIGKICPTNHVETIQISKCIDISNANFDSNNISYGNILGDYDLFKDLADRVQLLVEQKFYYATKNTIHADLLLRMKDKCCKIEDVDVCALSAYMDHDQFVKTLTYVWKFELKFRMYEYIF